MKSTLQDPLGNASLMKSCLMPPMALAQVLTVSLITEGFKLPLNIAGNCEHLRPCYGLRNSKNLVIAAN